MLRFISFSTFVVVKQAHKGMLMTKSFFQILEDGNMDFEEVSSEHWLKEKLSNEKKRMESGCRGGPLATSSPFPFPGTRMYRAVSQVLPSYFLTFQCPTFGCYLSAYIKME